MSFKEVANAEKSFASEDRSFDCCRCGVRFMPRDGQWIFYNLCDGCFARFDEQKMIARYIKVGLVRDDGKKRTESCSEWIEADIAGRAPS